MSDINSLAKNSTVIELFDSCQLENIASFLKFNPKKVIFIGFSNSDFAEKYDAISEVIKNIKPNILLEYVDVKRYDYDDIINKLESIIKSNHNCYFDLTGGKELVLVAMGELSTKYNVPMYQIDLHANKVIAIKDCDKLPQEDNIRLTLADSVSLNCGILENCDTPIADENYINTVNGLWNIAKNRNIDWNAETKAFVKFEKNNCRQENTNEFTCEMRAFNSQRSDFAALFSALKRQGYITTVNNGRILKYKYKNSHIRSYLKKSGNILEDYTYIIVKSIEAEMPNAIHDASIQVFVRWLDDGEESKIKNEIDVAFMCGIIPVFISCKSGTINRNALYELSTVANRLGGKYAKKILVATEIDPNPLSRAAVLDRAEEMDISVISDVSEIGRGAVIDKIKQVLF